MEASVSDADLTVREREGKGTVRENECREPVQFSEGLS